MHSAVGFSCPQARLTCSQGQHRHPQGIRELCSWADLSDVNLTATIDFLLSKSTLEWKREALACDFVLHCSFIMREGTVSVSETLEENFCLTQQPQDCETFSFLESFLSNFEAVNKASCGCVDLIQLFLIYWCFFPIFNLGFNEVVQWRALDGKGIEIEACKASPPSGDEAEVFLTKVSQTRGALTPQLFPHELLWTFQHILRQNQSAFRQSWREMEVKQAEMFSIGDVITRARRFTDRWHQGSSVNFLFNQLPVVQSMVIMCIPLI